MTKVLIPTLLLSFLTVVMVLGSVTPAMADSSGDGGDKSYKKYRVMPIGDSEGTIEITEDSDKAKLKEQVMPLHEVAAGYEDIHKAKLGQAVNDGGKYYLVWKLVSYSYDAESDSKTKTIYVLDAGNGVALTEPITKEGGSCGDKEKKSQSTRTSGDNA